MDSNQPKEPEKLPSDLTINPDGTATFTINEDGEVLGSYKGVFTLKCFLNPLDALQAGRIFREYLGPYGDSAGDNEKFTAFALSQLQKRVIKGPPWWEGDMGVKGNIPDNNILSLILDRSITAESTYKARLKAKKDLDLKSAQDALKAKEEALKADTKPAQPNES